MHLKTRRNIFFCESCSLSHRRPPASPPLSSLCLPPLGLDTPDVISTHINRNVFCLRPLMFVPRSEGLGSTSTALITTFPFFSELFSFCHLVSVFFFCRSEGAQMAWFFFLDNNGVYLSVMVVCWNIIIKITLNKPVGVTDGVVWWDSKISLFYWFSAVAVLCPVGGADETTWGH